ncbi:DUF2796 domain-containing protein [Aliikangiella coralliicola]|uniref:DUF2796 domain-containing protein n=1 Tax=Aliikangiella coralliicola TaxID=2592383 RepID=A0A545UGG8_9GAMM|nr:DUF2796 domain-containing protein [Aliikangiella coralliicola]TQV88574.1 DUF2796 domain-containing protein [Aliikangiella coralliicola]
MSKSFFLIWICCFGFVTADVIAGNQKSHVHGLVTLTLVLEKKTLAIKIESPAESLLGFEHKARQSSEKQAVKRAEKLLNSPELLFSIEGVNCKPKKSKVELSHFIDSEVHHHHGAHHEIRENHLKGHNEVSHSEISHSEISASYFFNCDSEENLEVVSVRLFKFFPRIEKVNAMWVTDLGQGAALLSSRKNTIPLK